MCILKLHITLVSILLDDSIKNFKQIELNLYYINLLVKYIAYLFEYQMKLIIEASNGNNLSTVIIINISINKVIDMTQISYT